MQPQFSRIDLFQPTQKGEMTDMNASMARRIRNAEAILISAIDRRRCCQRVWSRREETTQPTLRIPAGLAFASTPQHALATCTEFGHRTEGESKWSPTH